MLPNIVHTGSEFIMQRMIRIQRLRRKHGKQLHHHASARVVFHQVAQIRGKMRRGRITARHTGCEEILRSARFTVILVEYHRQHIVFIAHIPKHTLLGDANTISHILNGNTVEPTLADQLHRGIQHFLTPLLR